MIEKISQYVFTCDWPNEVCRRRLVVMGEHKLKAAMARARRDGWSFPGRAGNRLIRCPVHAWMPARPPGAPGHRR